MKDGFITALGTPFNKGGELAEKSFRKHIEDQIEAGASALLVMGTMGNEVYIPSRLYPKVVSTAADAVAGRCPVFVGAMDNSISRVRERIDALKDFPINGILATTPFYLSASQEELVTFFSFVADTSPFPLYLYDLWMVTKTKIEVETACRILKHPNVGGIKSGDLYTCKALKFNEELGDDVTVMYSGIDTFDIAYIAGISHNLDGMFSCSAALVKSMYDKLKKGDYAGGRKELAKIIRLRNILGSVGVFTGFTAAMNLLGFEGSFSPDYVKEPGERERSIVGDCLKEIGLL